ncbi:MAG: SGNH/GDSL hydrolase family protein [Candidatus Sumerlaeaceae bacterium]|nr:SGNH/GDSL hydrolase family protein [Candidatus Sumerlaeaceae bacterium]
MAARAETAPERVSKYHDGFALRDRDTVVFLGDSITAAQTYGKIVENYTLLRFPERRVRFHILGKGGDTAAGGLARLETDVFPLRPTVVTVAYGVNDIGWGLRADAEHKQRYLDGIRGIVRRCHARGIRVYICSAAPTAADPFEAENGFLRRMCDEGMALSRSLGGGAIDIQGTMREIQKKIWRERGTTEALRALHIEDGIHLNETGQIAMAYALLKGLGAPAEVSSATLDWKPLRVAGTDGCRVRQLRRRAGTLEFTRTDTGLPVTLGLIGHLAGRDVPLADGLNRYMLTVRGLPAGRWEVLADGRRVGAWDADRLASGVNLGMATPDPWEPGGPWDVQATVLARVTEARSQIELARRAARHYKLPEHTIAEMDARCAAINSLLEQYQRAAARPRAYRFLIRPAAP